YNHLSEIGYYKIPYGVPKPSMINQQEYLEFCKYHEKDLYSNLFIVKEQSFWFIKTHLKCFSFNKINHLKAQTQYCLLEIYLEKKVSLIRGIRRYNRFKQLNKIVYKYFSAKGDKSSLKALYTQIEQKSPQIPDLNPIEQI
ncbi:hypothetical protein ABPG72_005288, partial [Tetrahymena utriculariae]